MVIWVQDETDIYLLVPKPPSNDFALPNSEDENGLSV